jgi:dihydroorotate dehydrogenase
MNSLKVNFAGLELDNPIIAASAPPTETVANIVRCAEAGVGAVVTKTAADFEEDAFTLGSRRIYMDDRRMWAQSTFRRETLSLKAGGNLIKEAAKRVNIPIIASVGNLSLNKNEWLNSCLYMQDCGASMIQLDLFYLPQPRAARENLELLSDMLTTLTSRLSIPVAPKVNIDLPASLCAQILKNTHVSAVFAMDSIRVPVPLDLKYDCAPKIKNLVGSRDCSMYGEWQKPITLQYVSTFFRELSMPISASGGLTNGWDAIEAMLHGAATVQYATSIIRNGFGQINLVKTQMLDFLDAHPIYHGDIQNLIGAAQRSSMGHEPHGSFLPAKAIYTATNCIHCGNCTDLVFCNAIQLSDSGDVKISESCDGCGLCESVCNRVGAIKVIPSSILHKHSV